MKILFIYSGTEYLGIEYLSSYLKSKGHETYLLYDPAVFRGDVFIDVEFLANFFSIDSKIVKCAIELKPDIIAFSAYSRNYRWCLNLAQSIKQSSNIPIVFGGVHPTAVPERVLENRCVDFVITGEGEYALLDLVEHLERNEPAGNLANVPNICFKIDSQVIINPPRSYIKDLDSLPFPDKKLFLDKEPLFAKNSYHIMTARGCPFNCYYCSNNMLQDLYCNEKHHVRSRSVENVIEEIMFNMKQRKLYSIIFDDDTFTFSRKWLEDFSEKYCSMISLPFCCNVHPLTITKETVSILKEMKCTTVMMGVQSFSERIRKEVFNRKESDEKIIEAIISLKEANIKVNIDVIVGPPTETEDDLAKNIQACRKVLPDGISTLWLTYYPKTRITNIAIERGILKKEDVVDFENGYIGYTYSHGSIDKKNISLYSKYELILQLSTLCKGNDWLFAFFKKIVPYIPCRKFLSLALYTITSFFGIGLVWRRHLINKIRYVFSTHKRCP